MKILIPYQRIISILYYSQTIYIYIKGLSYLVAKDLLGLLDGGKKKDLPGETRTAMVYDR
jgi:hypothetical protein